MEIVFGLPLLLCFGFNRFLEVGATADAVARFAVRNDAIYRWALRGCVRFVSLSVSGIISSCELSSTIETPV